MSQTSNSDITHLKKIRVLADRVAQLEALLDQQQKDNHILVERIQKFERGMAGVQAGVFEWDIPVKQLFLTFPTCIGTADQWNKISAQPESLKRMVSPEVYLVLQRKWLALLSGKSDSEQASFDIQLPGMKPCRILVYTVLQRDQKGKPEAISGLLFTQNQGNAFLAFSDDFVLFDALPIGVVSLDLRSGNLLHANVRAREILQLPQDISTSEEDPFNKINWSEVSEELIGHDFIDKKEMEVRLADGSKKWILFSGRPVDEQTLYAAILDYTDIRNTLGELQKVNFELDNFVYHASHDLRAPLRTVLGLLSLLKQETSKQERIRCVELIEGTINRLDTLVVDLLSISRNNRTQHRFVEINFMVEVNLAVSNFYHVGNTKNLEISTKISQPVHYVSDLTRIRIVLNNLISNAIKYRRHHQSLSFIDIRIWVDQHAAHLEIQDNGEGISQDKLPHIFDMFYRASEKSEGSGLGLYIVKDVVEKLNGTIEVESIEGSGTTFRLTLPNHYKTVDE